jgi:hypothetical protein
LVKQAPRLGVQLTRNLSGIAAVYAIVNILSYLTRQIPDHAGNYID